MKSMMPTPGDGSRRRSAGGEELRDIGEILWDHRLIESVLKRAVRDALLRHKRLGQSIAVWRDGKVVELPPEEIPV
jgi:hypothetical protein